MYRPLLPLYWIQGRCAMTRAIPPWRSLGTRESTACTWTVGDLFCGFGGFSCGAEQTGLKVLFGADKWQPAVDVFQANHPEARVYAEDLLESDFKHYPRVNLLLASPSCKGLTRARGRERAHHEQLRKTIWAPLRYAEVHKPDAMIIENVTEIEDWKVYPLVLAMLRHIGYHVDILHVDAADHGLPQNRVRWICIARLMPVWPPNWKMRPLGSLAKQPHVSVRDFIQWDYPKWSLLDKPGRSEKIKRQVRTGRKDLGTDCFLFPYYGSGSGLTGRSLDRPCGTIVAQDIWAIARGEEMRMMQPTEAQAIMGFPESYKLLGTRRNKMRGLGNAVCPPIAKALVELLIIDRAARGMRS